MITTSRTEVSESPIRQMETLCITEQILQASQGGAAQVQIPADRGAQNGQGAALARDVPLTGENRPADPDHLERQLIAGRQGQVSAAIAAEHQPAHRGGRNRRRDAVER